MNKRAKKRQKRNHLKTYEFCKTQLFSGGRQTHVRKNKSKMRVRNHQRLISHFFLFHLLMLTMPIWVWIQLKDDNIYKQVNKCVLGIFEATFRKQINLSDGHHGHQSGLSWLVTVLSCWWMTPLLYHSMLCHLQLNTTVALPPPHKSLFLCVCTGRNYSGSNEDKGRNDFL